MWSRTTLIVLSFVLAIAYFVDRREVEMSNEHFVVQSTVPQEVVTEPAIVPTEAAEHSDQATFSFRLLRVGKPEIGDRIEYAGYLDVHRGDRAAEHYALTFVDYECDDVLDALTISRLGAPPTEAMTINPLETEGDSNDFGEWAMTTFPEVVGKAKGMPVFTYLMQETEL